jgi:hypothetical protein
MTESPEVDKDQLREKEIQRMIVAFNARWKRQKPKLER